MCANFIVFTIFGLAFLANRLRKKPTVFNILIFTISIGGALILPFILGLLPSWIIPSQFSDFSFWGTLIRSQGVDLLEYITFTPGLRDITYITLFFKQIGLSFISVIFALLICFRYFATYVRRDFEY